MMWPLVSHDAAADNTSGPLAPHDFIMSGLPQQDQRELAANQSHMACTHVLGSSPGLLSKLPSMHLTDHARMTHLAHSLPTLQTRATRPGDLSPLTLMQCLSKLTTVHPRVSLILSMIFLNHLHLS